MSDDKVEVDKEFAKQIFELANIPKTTEVTSDSLKDAVTKIKSAINPGDIETFNPSTNNILVIDDIGVVTYQLRMILTNLGYNVQVAKDIYTAINCFVKSKYAFVIMDLFVSTEQEGYTLLHETKKIITKGNMDTKIIVITASAKAENKIKCLNGGADYFLKKDAGWQDEIIKLVENTVEDTSQQE